MGKVYFLIGGDKMNSLFDREEMKKKKFEFKPLAERMRPTTLENFFGQEEIVGENSPIRQMIENDLITSMIFWGPPGVGKTTLAKIIAKQTDSLFYELSAVTAGVKEIKEMIEISKFNKLNGKKTICFVDEIHRFNKSQQDAFLPHVENGNIILIGATTENPSFEVNSALLSRSKVYVLKSLSKEDIVGILTRALKETREYRKVEIDQECLYIIADVSSGDARTALNTLENLMDSRKTFKITDTENDNWKNYSYFDNILCCVATTKESSGEVTYGNALVWVPRYTMVNDEIAFLYKDTNYPIVPVYANGYNGKQKVAGYVVDRSTELVANGFTVGEKGKWAGITVGSNNYELYSQMINALGSNRIYKEK